MGELGVVNGSRGRAPKTQRASCAKDNGTMNVGLMRKIPYSGISSPAAAVLLRAM